jgi:hypothetical protein
MNCTFAIFDDNDNRVTSIPPGTYQVEISTPIMFKLVRPGGVGVDNIAPNDFTGCKGWVQFQITGPGVDWFTTLDSGCDAFQLLPPSSFKANATYTLQDLNQPAVTRTSLTVLGSGSPPIPKSPYTPTSGKGQTFSDLVGSGILKVRATLKGSLSPAGTPVLTNKGKNVSTLKAGRYKFVVTDENAKRGFTIQSVKADKPTYISGIRFVGKHSKTLVLKAGQWMYSSGLGKVHYFRVTS